MTFNDNSLSVEKRCVILEFINYLKDLDYFIFGGFGIYIYTNGKRKFDDIDILMNYESLNKLANKFNKKVKKRSIKKGDFVTKDYYFDLNFKGQEIEAISFIPNKISQKNSFEKQFYNKEKINFYGKEIFIVPKEGIVVHKISLSRKKDINDLKLLKGNLKKNLLKEIIKLRKENTNKYFNPLKKLGYNFI